MKTPPPSYSEKNHTFFYFDWFSNPVFLSMGAFRITDISLYTDPLVQKIS